MIQLNLIKTINGGIGMDDDMNQLGDYHYSIKMVCSLLEMEGLKGPFTILSNNMIKTEASIGNHFGFFAIEYVSEKEDDGSIWLGPIPIKKAVVNELEYVLSREYIKEWLVESMKDYIFVYDDLSKKAVRIGRSELSFNM